MTRQGHAESQFFEKAQNFFSQSQKAVKNYLISGKGLDDEAYNQKKSDQKKQVQKKSNKNSNYKLDPLIGSQVIEADPGTHSTPKYNQPFDPSNKKSFNQSFVNPSDDQALNPSSMSTYNQSSDEDKVKYAKVNALYFSLISQSVSDDNDSNPAYGLSLAISIPVISTFSLLSSEFQFSGDIKNAGDWGQVQFLQKEAMSIFRISDTKVDLFMGLGFGFGHGSLIASKDRYFAPWAVGLQWGKIYQKDKIFYRFELGWAGDFYFADAKYSQGLLANLSLGYKL